MGDFNSITSSFLSKFNYANRTNIILESSGRALTNRVHFSIGWKIPSAKVSAEPAVDRGQAWRGDDRRGGQADAEGGVVARGKAVARRKGRAVAG